MPQGLPARQAKAARRLLNRGRESERDRHSPKHSPNLRAELTMRTDSGGRRGRPGHQSRAKMPPDPEPSPRPRTGMDERINHEVSSMPCHGRHIRRGTP